MPVLTFTLSEEGVTVLRDALNCLKRLSDDVSLEARKESFVLTTLNSSKSSYASFKLAINRFFSRYNYQGSGQFRDRFYCSLHTRSLISLFRSRSSADSQRDAERQTLIEKCDVAIEDGEGVNSLLIVRLVFRNGLTSTHRLPFEVAVPVHAKFNKQEAPHHWTISSRTLRQLMDHFGPGIEYLDINTDGDRVNFTCFNEKTVTEDTVLSKPLQTSVAMEVDEFEDIEVEDKLHVVISVKDFRAIIQHAGITSNTLSARYSLPAQPIQFSYANDAISCEFLIMTVGERGSTPHRKTKKGRKSERSTRAELEATPRRTSTVPSQTSRQQPCQAPDPAAPAASRSRPSNPVPYISSAKAGASRIRDFDLRPSQKPPPPPPTVQSESLFVDDEGWEPVRVEDEGAEDDPRLEWDHSAELVSLKGPVFAFSATLTRQTAPAVHMDQTHSGRLPKEGGEAMEADGIYLEPTQKLSDVEGLALFPD